MDFKKGLVQVISLFALFLISFQVVSATSNVIDVKISEAVYDQVTYNPLKASSGLFVDANENRSIYNLTGNIFIKNTHSTEAVENIVLNISGISNIYNITNSAGKVAIVSEFNTASDYMIIKIPDLGAGDNTTLSYIINETKVAPPLNFTSSYSKEKIFAGLPLTVFDNVENVLNSSTYPNNCIYNINITQNTLFVNQSGNLLNFTYDNTSMAGLDASNASFTIDNRTINWNLWNGQCFNSTDKTNISYSVNTPDGINLADNYKFINSTISYNINATVSTLNLNSIRASTDLDLNFQKKINQSLPTGDNATWFVSSNVSSPSNITVNLTQVTLWVSKRNGTGTGFTNPSIHDNDTVSGLELLKTFTPNILLNNTQTPWNTNSSTGWYFNYTLSSSPIVWMDIQHHIVNDGVQITNHSVTYGNNSIYIKEVYIVIGYWLQIEKNITRLSDNNYTITIKVMNLGNSPTPSGQIVQIYNFLPNTFALTSPFVYSNSPWYNTTNTSEVLTDPIYNGTMYQFALIPNSNPSSSSLNLWGGASNQNNTWTATFNVTGSGEFKYDDLFLTGVDPLHVDEYGSTKALSVEGAINFVSDKFGIALGIAAVIIGAIGLLL